jgi:hypothetical protein
MRRSIRQYTAGKPYDMAHNQSSMAIMYAFEDMQADIIALHRHLTELMAWLDHSDAAQTPEPLANIMARARKTLVEVEL